MANAPNIPEVFAERLREHRQARKLSQASMAKRLSDLGLPKMRRETIAKIETRQRQVTIEEAVAIAAVLDVPLLELLRPLTKDVALTPKLELRGSFALGWMSGRGPLKRRGVKGYREATDAIRKTADTFELLIHPRGRAGRLRAAETEMIRAYVASKRQDLAELEHVAGRNESLAKLMRDEIENARDTVTKLEKLLPKEEQ